MREDTFKQYGRECCKCKKKKNLHVHHKTYERLGKEHLNDLMVLCKDCHSKEHYIIENKNFFNKREKQVKREIIKTPLQLEMERRMKDKKYAKEVRQKLKSKPTLSTQEQLNKKYGLI